VADEARLIAIPLHLVSNPKLDPYILDEHNGEAKPFTWTADLDKIVAAVKRDHQALDSIH
jgi:hypothetical protein